MDKLNGSLDKTEARMKRLQVDSVTSFVQILPDLVEFVQKLVTHFFSGLDRQTPKPNRFGGEREKRTDRVPWGITTVTRFVTRLSRFILVTQNLVTLPWCGFTQIVSFVDQNVLKFGRFSHMGQCRAGSWTVWLESVLWKMEWPDLVVFVWFLVTYLWNLVKLL